MRKSRIGRGSGTSYFLAVGILASLGVVALSGRTYSPPYRSKTAPCTAPEKKTEKAISFTQYRNLIFFPVRVNGSEPLCFVLDSAGTGMIDRGRAKELGLKLEKGGQGIGVGDGTFDYDLARNVCLQFAGLEVSLPEIKVVDLFPFHLTFGRRVDGTLGYPVFARYVVAVDNEKRKLTFHNPKTFVYSGRGDRIPLTTEGKVPHIMGKLKVYGQPEVERSFMIDTGLARTTVGDDLIAKSSSRKLEISTGVGLGKEKKGVASRVEKLQLGSFKIEKAHGKTARWSAIGGGILSRFNMVFDYSRGQLILEPNSRFAEPYRYDACGMELRLAKDLKHFRVHAVLPDSPAAAAGVRAEDMIIAINGRTSAKYDLTEVQDLFMDIGATYRLKIRRQQKEWEVTIKFRELI
jgi:hypothetical protein